MLSVLQDSERSGRHSGEQGPSGYRVQHCVYEWSYHPQNSQCEGRGLDHHLRRHRNMFLRGDECRSAGAAGELSDTVCGRQRGSRGSDGGGLQQEEKHVSWQ